MYVRDVLQRLFNSSSTEMSGEVLVTADDKDGNQQIIKITDIKISQLGSLVTLVGKVDIIIEK
jgi:hypothetical protein